MEGPNGLQAWYDRMADEIERRADAALETKLSRGTMDPDTDPSWLTRGDGF